MRQRAVKTAILLACSLAGLLGSGAASASALTPWWHLTSGSRPTNLPPGGNGEVVVTVSNLGDERAAGEAVPILIRDQLPSGVEATGSVRAVTPLDSKVTAPECSVSSGSVVLCSLTHEMPAYAEVELLIAVHVGSGAALTSQVNKVEVSGGGARSISLARPLTISETPTPFGVETYEAALEEEGGSPDTRAGSHPFQFTTSIALNQGVGNEPARMAKDLSFKLPPGLIGNPSVLPHCTLAQFSADLVECPPQTVLGVAAVTFNEPGTIGIQTYVTPVYNLEPNIGEPARLGLRPTKETPVYIDTSVRTGTDYGVTAEVHNIIQNVGFLRSDVTLWGVPGLSTHDSARGDECLQEELGVGSGATSCKPLGELYPPPFFVTPTSCPRNTATGAPEPLSTSVEADSWSDVGAFRTFPGEPMPAMDNCDQLPFSPSIAVASSVGAASSPTGLAVDVHVNQESVLHAKSLAESAVKQITVALPPGVAINPAGGDGLLACDESEIGFTGGDPAGALTFTPTEPDPSCPEAAKVGTVEIVSPLLPKGEALKGAVYIATQNENPFGSLLALYIVAEDPISGVLVKLPGEVQLTESGQIVTTFKNTPQLAFEEAKLEFFGGSRAPLASPPHCGAYTTAASFVPWAAEPSDEAAVTVPASSTFDIVSGPNGSACPGASLPFSPSLTAGTTNIYAGSPTPLSTTIGRGDGEQNMQSVALHTPPGLSGMLSGVKLCAEAQANEGTCGPESLIGETTVAAGVGSEPVFVKGGKVYITEKYDGAPFGLSIVNPVKAGPFDLEHDTSKPRTNMPSCDCVVVRAKIEVNPVTAALTVTTDPSGPHAIPHFIDGVPVQIQKVNVLVNRPGFTFNPTSCENMTIAGAISSFEGASSNVNVPFKVHDCGNLSFKPSFEVSTSGKTSRKNGASLHVVLTYPNAPQGTQANIKSVHVELPKALPSRLSTLNHACVDSVFSQNPANCPSESRVGFAKAVTPVLPVPLEGPAYFVSHGGQKFPELIVVLQGYGVTVDLEGETFISGAGVTSSTFNSVADVPVSTFELTLPEKPFSALAANRNLCTTNLTMPTKFTGQNGAVLEQKTKIAVTGCKPRIKVLHHSVHGGVATFTVGVPSVGRLKAGGSGFVQASKWVGKPGTSTISLSLSAGERRILAAHPGRRLRMTVNLLFVPRRGKRLRASATVLIR